MNARTATIQKLSTDLAAFQFGEDDLDTKLQAARDLIEDLLRTESEPDAVDTLDLARDCIDFAIEYSRGEMTADTRQDYVSAVGDVLLTLRSCFLN